ncbi:MAG: hypothetical protein CL534_25335 [Ahrensia sp.]|nr:hypothetical protein [Ahrensia sp.]
MSDDRNGNYDRRTLISAALLLVGFALILYFLPSIMMAIGAQSPVLAAAVVAAVLLLPFIGLWLRGRSRRNK